MRAESEPQRNNAATLTQYMSKFYPTIPGSEFDQSTVEFTLSATVKATRVEAG